MPAVGEGKRRRYPEASLELLRLLVALKKEGRSSEQIRAELARRSTPQEKTRRKTTESQLEEVLALLRIQAGELAALRAEVGELRSQLRARTAPPIFPG